MEARWFLDVMEGDRKSGGRVVRLIALCVVVSVSVMIGLGVVWSLCSGCGSSKITQAESDFKILNTALVAYKLLADTYPTTEQGLEAFVRKPTVSPVPERWNMIMSRVPLDPWGRVYSYRWPGSRKTEEPEILSMGPDGVANTEDDLSSRMSSLLKCRGFSMSAAG